MADELTTALIRFEESANAAHTDDVAGLNPLTPAIGAYPSTAAALAAAVGYGTWSGGWLDDDARAPRLPLICRALQARFWGRVLSDTCGERRVPRDDG